MNFKTIVLFTLGISLFSHFAEGQQLSIGYNLRFETFEMTELRDLQANVISEWPIDAQNLVDMPSRLTHSGSINYYLNNIYSFGLSAGFGSTGSRYYYEDYSGYISNDFITNRIDINGEFSYYHSLKIIELFFRAEPGVSLSTLKIRTKSNVVEQIHEDKIQFKSISSFVRSGIGIRKKINRFFIESVLLYEYNFPSKLKLNTDSDLYLRNPDGNPIDSNWSGIKVNMSVGFMLIN